MTLSYQICPKIIILQDLIHISSNEELNEMIVHFQFTITEYHETTELHANLTTR